MPSAKSMIIVAYRELDNCESDNMQIAFNGRMDIMEFARSCGDKLARFLQNQFDARIMTMHRLGPLLCPTYPKAIR